MFLFRILSRNRVFGVCTVNELVQSPSGVGVLDIAGRTTKEIGKIATFCLVHFKCSVNHVLRHCWSVSAKTSKRMN